MTIDTCRFVTASALFKGLRKLWAQLAESSPDFTWGSNNRSMVVPKAILDHLDNSVIDNEKQLKTLRRRAASLPADVYVDLEN